MTQVKECNFLKHLLTLQWHFTFSHMAMSLPDKVDVLTGFSSAILFF